MIIESWERWKLSHAYGNIGSGTTPTSSDDRYYADSEGTPWITTGELRENRISKTVTLVTDEALRKFSALRVYNRGTVLVAMYGATIGRLGITDVTATCNQACCAFEDSEQFDNRFLFYWLWHRRSDLIALSSGGGQPNLSQQDLREEKALCPPLETQRGIVKFLDNKTRQINQLIDEKFELLDRLAEKRQALITQAVTRGLNSSLGVKQRASNLPLHEMAECPENWSIKRLKYVATYNDEKLSEKTDEDKEIRYVEISDVSLMNGIELASQMTFGESPSRARRIARGGDILVSTVRTYLRAIATVDESSQEGLVASTGFCVVRPGGEVDGGFLGWAVKSELFIAEVVSRSVGASYPGINADDLAKIEVPIPPIETQKEIASFLDEESAKIDALAEKVNEMVGLLEEYRSALITSSVTGKTPKLSRSDVA